MILRAAFSLGLVWFAMAHGADLGFAPAAQQSSGAMATMQRLADMKSELNQAASQRHTIMVAGAQVVGISEAVQGMSDRLAGRQDRSAP